MLYAKRCQAGFSERMALIERILPEPGKLTAEVLKGYRRKDVTKDNIADALVALMTAMPPEDELKTLPEMPELDSKGIPMEIGLPKNWLSQPYAGDVLI